MITSLLIRPPRVETVTTPQPAASHDQAISSSRTTRADKDGEDPPGVSTGILSLSHGDTKVGEGRIKTQAGKFMIGEEGLCVGRDSGEPITDDYPGAAPHRFAGGTIERVGIDVSGPRRRWRRRALPVVARVSSFIPSTPGAGSAASAPVTRSWR
jgi:hypothetical protein